MVNVLDVPVQENVLFQGSRNVSSSSLDSVVFTLDPQDKYLPSGVRRASTTSAVHARKARLPTSTRPMVRAQYNCPTTAEVVPQTSKRTQDVLITDKQHSLLSVFHRMRQTRSAGSNAKSNLAWPRKIFSRAGRPTKHEAPDPVPEMAKLPDRALSLSPTRTGDGPELPSRLPSTADTTYRAPTAFMVNCRGSKNHIRPLEQLSSGNCSDLIPLHEGEQGLEDEDATSVPNSKMSFLSSYHTPVEQLRDSFPCFASTAAEERDVVALSDNLDRLNLAPYGLETFTDLSKMPFHEHTTILDAIPSTESPGSIELDSHSPKYGYAESLASYAASANFSPCLASNTTHSGPMSPYHLSQPETPAMSDFGDELSPTLHDSESPTQLGTCTSSDFDLPLSRYSSIAGSPNLPRPQQGGGTYTSHTTFRGFQGYSLPDHDQASVLTIRKPPSLATFKKIEGPSPFITQQKSKQDLVHSWNDGSEHHMTALGELVDDLGYLGKLII